MKTKFFACMAAAMLVGAVPQPSAAHPQGWVYNLKVIRIVNTSNGGFNVRFSPDLTDCVSQSGYGAVYGSIYPTHPGLNRLKADFLLAYTSGDLVSVYLGDVNCTISETILGG